MLYDDDKLVRKRRIDSLINLSAGVFFPVAEGFSAGVVYDGTGNISTFGKNDLDYADWNYFRHVITGEINYVF